MEGEGEVTGAEDGEGEEMGEEVQEEILVEALAEEVQEGEDLAEDGRFNVLFRKGMIDSDPELLRYNSVKELVEYVYDKNANIERVKLLITKANRELRLRYRGKQLYVRKSNSRDKEAENRICIINK